MIAAAVLLATGLASGLASGPASGLASGPASGLASGPASGLASGLVVGDGMPQPLTAIPGDAERGRAIVVNRTMGLCLLCHSGPFDRTPEERSQGNLAGNLSGTGSRWTVPQLRLRIADARRLNPEGLMPSLHVTEGQVRPGRAFAGKPVLDAQQVEDVVAFLRTLQ